MSQQELMPEPQSSRSSQESYNAQSQGKQSWSSAEVNIQPYSRTRRSRTSDLPKSDHPATFEESLPPYSYPAQDQTMFRQQSKPEQNTRWQQQARNRDAGTSKETPTGAYQSYSQYNPQQQAPWWAQSQENTMDTSKWIGLLLLVLVLLVSIPVLCSIGTVFVSVVFIFSLLPVVLAFAPIAFFLLIPLFRVLGPDSHDNRRRHRSRYDHSWWW
jgi:hypothetical protein